MNKLILENKYLNIVVLPELGGRIDSILYKPTNKNWVWKNKQLNNSYVSKYANYDDNWQGGWEELFPNDAVEDFTWGKGLDHGELWSSKWKVEFSNVSEVLLSTDNLDSGTIFLKKISIFEKNLFVNYEADIKFSDFFLFKLHLAIPIDKKLEVISDCQIIKKVEKNFGNIINQKDESFFQLEKDSGYYDFGYLDLKTNKVLVKDHHNNLMELIFDDENLRYFWMFQSQGAWRKHNVLVLEPASNSRKYLDDAISKNSAIKGPLQFKCGYKVNFYNE